MLNRVIAVINGPNMNLLGQREPEFYGTMSLNEIEQGLKALMDEKGYQVIFFQSNSESDIVSFIHEKGDNLQGIIINPAAFSKTAYSILDAIKAFDLPFIEVHLSNIFSREQWHSESIFLSMSLGCIIGFKEISYGLAVQAMIHFLEERAK